MNNTPLAGEHILVTGGAGFIGSHLVDNLLTHGAEVTVLDNLSHGEPGNVNDAARLLVGDVRDAEMVGALVEGCSRVFHLAAEATTKETAMGWNDPFHDLSVNALGTLTVLEAVRTRNRDAAVVVVSSAAVYGPPTYTPMDEHHPTNPVSPYGVTKLAAEKYATSYATVEGLQTSVARIFNTYGPRQRRYVMYDLIRKLQRDPDRLELIGDGTQVRDYTYVSDTVRALVMISSSPPGTVMNISSGHHLSVRELAQMICNIVSPTAAIETGTPTWKGDIDRLIGDPTKIKTEFGFEARISLEAGLARLVEWTLDQTPDDAA